MRRAVVKFLVALIILTTAEGTLVVQAGATSPVAAVAATTAAA